MAGVLSGQTAAQEAAKSTEAEVEKLHAKVGQLLVERDFCRKRPYDERGATTADERARSPAAADGSAVRVGLAQPLGVLLPAQGETPLNLADAVDLRAVWRDWRPNENQSLA